MKLLNVPIFRVYLGNCIAVTRKNPTEDFKKVMSQGAEMISRGWSIIVFPQAMRSAVFDPSQFNTLGVKLARKARVPVIPLAVKTSKKGVEVIGISEVKPGKLQELIDRTFRALIEFNSIDGFEYSVEVYSTAAEALGRYGQSVPQ